MYYNYVTLSRYANYFASFFFYLFPIQALRSYILYKYDFIYDNPNVIQTIRRPKYDLNHDFKFRRPRNCTYIITL